MHFVLTHPHLSKASLAQFDLQLQWLPRDLPGIFSEPLSLRLDRGADHGQLVAESVSVLCDMEMDIAARMLHFTKLL